MLLETSRARRSSDPSLAMPISHTNKMAIGNESPLNAFCEATPPGAAPGPPIKTGARVRHFWGCNKRGCSSKLSVPGVRLPPPLPCPSHLRKPRANVSTKGNRPCWHAARAAGISGSFCAKINATGRGGDLSSAEARGARELLF